VLVRGIGKPLSNDVRCAPHGISHRGVRDDDARLGDTLGAILGLLIVGLLSPAQNRAHRGPSRRMHALEEDGNRARVVN
jgi:hypothetical protein